MDAVEVPVLVEELETLHVPGDVAGVGHDLEVRHRGDEAALQLIEVALIGERECPLRLLQHLQREPRRSLSLGVEVSLERRRGILRASGAFPEQSTTADRKGGPNGWNGLHELSTSCHFFTFS